MGFHSSITDISEGISELSVPRRAANIYLGINYSVRFSFSYFEFLRKVSNADECGMLYTELHSFTQFERMELSPGGERVKSSANAGGSSIESEALSACLLERCFGAKLKKTEMEIEYFPVGGSMTDYMCEIFCTNLGVSVTRAMKYKGNYTIEDAMTLLRKKLTGVLNASKNALEGWHKQLLHVWTPTRQVALAVKEAYIQLGDETKGNTVVLVTTAQTASELFTKKCRGMY
jgi:hypothetical protein